MFLFHLLKELGYSLDVALLFARSNKSCPNRKQTASTYQVMTSGFKFSFFIIENSSNAFSIKPCCPHTEITVFLEKLFGAHGKPIPSIYISHYTFLLHILKQL